VIDLAQYEAVAQTQGNCMPLYTGQGVTYGHTGNRAPGFQPYDTFKCSDGWVFVGALGDPMVSRLAAFLRLDAAVYNFGSVSSDVAAVNSPEGKEFDRRLREYCAGKTTLEAENELNAARIGCARVLNPADQYADRQYNAREMTVPVLDRQSGVPVRVYGVVPKMSLTPGRIWRGAASIGEDTTDILCNLLGLSPTEIDRLYGDEVVHRTEPFTTPQVAAVHP
jgi:crotonobetainyl-CoA:carnitine CoA-transferase CaiB-like acyl-CoA transferase